MHCFALFCGSWHGSVVPVITIRLRNFALTCDHTVTGHGIVTVANAGARSAFASLHNSDDGNLHETRDLGKIFISRYFAFPVVFVLFPLCYCFRSIVTIRGT